MSDYQTMYFHLFNHVTDAIAALECLDFGKAKDILICAQQETEDLYMNEGEINV